MLLFEVCGGTAPWMIRTSSRRQLAVYVPLGLKLPLVHLVPDACDEEGALGLTPELVFLEGRDKEKNGAWDAAPKPFHCEATRTQLFTLKIHKGAEDPLQPLCSFN